MAQVVQVVALVEALDVDESLIVLVQIKKAPVALLVRKLDHIWHFFLATQCQVHLFEFVRKWFCNILGPRPMKVFDCAESVVELFEFIWTGDFRYLLLSEFILVNINVLEFFSGVNRPV